MATTEKYYDGDGSNKTFAIPASIPFLDKDDIKVQVGSLKVATGTNSAGQTLTHGIATAEFPNDTDLKVRISNVLKTLNTDYTLSANKEVITFTDAVPNVADNIRVCTNGLTQNQGTDYTINTSNEVAFDTAPADTKSVRIYRETAIENLKGGEFAAGTAITAEQLNDNANQLLYAAQEFPANFGDARNYGWNIPPATKNDIQVISDTDWKIVDNAITEDMLQDDSVTTDKIKDLNVTTAKLANNSVSAAKIPDGSITHSKLASDTNIYRAYASLRDYGATGDGVADDTTAIKNAIAAQDGGSPSNNVLYFPAGTYLVTEPIEIPSNTYIQGAGIDRTVIKMKNTIGRETGLCIIGKPTNKVENVTVNDITFDGNKQRWHDYNNSSGTSTTGTGFANYTGQYGASVTSGATYTQSGKIVTVTKTSHGLEQGAHVTIISADNDTSSIVNADHANNPSWEIIEVSSNTFKLLVGPSQTISSNAITYKECVERANSKGLFIHNARNVRLNRVKVVDSPGHNFDISSTATHGAPIDPSTGSTFDSTASGYFAKANLYHGRYSENIYLNQCQSKGAGDDNFTTHFSTDIRFNDCYSESPRGGKSTSSNCNCYEIDDGSSNVTISNCHARGGNDALEIKAHEYAPAPFNIYVNGFTAINSTKGVSLHHSGWQINTDKTDTAWKAYGGSYSATYAETSTSAPSDLRYSASPKLSDNGYSLHAHSVQLSNIRIFALTTRTLHKLDGSGDETSASVEPEHALRIAGYRGVSIDNFSVFEGLADRKYGGTAINGEMGALFDYNGADVASSDSDALIMLRRSCRDITFSNLLINGYWNQFARAVWIRRRTDANQQEQNNGGITFNGYTCIDGPLIAFEGDGSDETYWGSLTGYSINQTQQIPTQASEDPGIGSHFRAGTRKAIDVNSDLFQLGSGTVRGYPADRSMDYQTWPLHAMNEGSSTTDETVAVDTEECYFQRFGNLVFCSAHLEDISTGDHGGAADTNDFVVTLPFEPAHSTVYTGSCSISNMDLEDGSENACNIICVAKDGNMYKKDGIQYKGYVKFKITYQGDGSPQVDDYLRLADIDESSNELWFQLWYFAEPNAIPNK